MTDDRRQRIEQLYLDALDVPVIERPEFLHRSCAGDLALRGEVEALLALESGAETFLEQPAIESAAQTLADIMPALRPPEIPGYQILRHLGEGGMGLVYLAKQEAPLRRLVALKVIRPGMDSRQIVARFNAERQALAQMDHPNIAAVHDAGATSDGRPYFVMEFVDGLPISEYCDRKGLSTVERLELFTQVCAAVQHAHQKGVIHRDLKPSNVLVTEQDGRPVPKVIDFGTAKAIARSPEGDAVTLTAQGMALGTIEYMSPEQAAFSRDIDTTTDVYSLGVMLYELLVGVLPFERPRPGPEGYDELRRLIRESDPPRPSTRLSAVAKSRSGIALARQTDPDRLKRSLQGDLDWITLKALEKERPRRYPTVAAFASDVRRFLLDQPVDARPPSAWYRVRKFTLRHRGGVAATVALFVVLVAGLATTRSQYLRAIAALDLADYRNYVITIAAADHEIQESRFSDARERLLTVDPARRGWEWEQLSLRADNTLLVLADRAPCASAAPGDSPVLSIDTLAKDPDGKRIYFKHCQRVNSWNTETLEHSVAHSAPNVILATAPFGRRVEAATPVGIDAGETSDEATLPSAKTWSVYVVDSFGVQSPRLTIDSAPACADLSQDGRTLALGFHQLPSNPIVIDDKAATATKTDVFGVWDVETGRRLWQVELPQPPGVDTRLADGMHCFVRLSPDTTLLATSGAVVGLWVTTTGKAAYVDSGQAGLFPQAIAFSPTNRQLAIGRRNGLIDLLRFVNSEWTLKSLDGGQLVRPRPLNERDRFSDVNARRHEEVRAVDFSEDGQTLVSALTSSVIVWDLPSARIRKVLDVHQSPVTGLVVHGGLAYSAHADATVKVEELEGSSGVTKIGGSTPLLGRVELSADGRLVALGSAAGSLTVWHLDERREVVLRPPPGARIDSGFSIGVVVPLADHRTILTGAPSSLGTLMRWDSETQQPVSLPSMDREDPLCPGRAVTHASVSPNDRYLALLMGRCVVVRDLASAKTLRVFSVDRAGFSESSGSYVKFLTDDSILIAASHRQNTPGSASGANSVIRWDWTTDRITANRPFPMPSTMPFAVTASKDGNRVAVTGGGVVTVWDGILHRAIARISLSPDLNRNLLMALSADGARLAIATFDRTSVFVWDTEKSQQLLTLTAADVPRFLAFTPSGQLIAVDSSGGLTIWETRRRSCPKCPKPTASAR